jgi:hypothetical protein
MNLKFNRLAFGLVSLSFLVFFHGAAAAQGYETSFTYNGLYKSIKTASANEFSQVALNFYLLKKQPQLKDPEICPVESGFISDGELKIDLMVSERGQMLLPIDKSLKQDHAAITIITPEPNMCLLKMQIEVASFELANASLRSIKGWTSQITALYAKLAGWPGRYFMPNLVGLNFKLSETGPGVAYFIDADQRQIISKSNIGTIYLSLQELERLSATGRLEFSSELIAVTPQLSN